MPENIVTAGNEQSKYFPYSDRFHLQRNTFWDAGQDSYTLPPAQDPDKFTLLQNIEPVLQGSLRRRRGYQLLTGDFSLSGHSFVHNYSFRSEILGLRSLVWASLGVSPTVVATDESGIVLNNPIFIPFANATYVPRMVLSRSFGYFGDGVRPDYVKWDGTTRPLNLTNWGISVQLATPAATFGPVTSGSVTNNAGGGNPWTPTAGTLTTAVNAADGVYDTVTLTSPSDSDYLRLENFTFAGLSNSATVTGVKIDVKGFKTSSAVSSLQAYILKAGVQAGTPKNVPLTTSNGFVTLGGAGDTWGLPLLGSDANTSSFGVQFTVGDSSGGTITWNLDIVQITIYVSGSSIVLGAPAGTGITVLSGRVYTVAYQNSSAGTVSDIFPFSASTGPLTNQGQPLSGLPVSNDPQVDFKLLLATADGGDETTLFLVAQLPNSQTTYTDTMPESTLLTQPVYQETQADGTLHGVANNKIPPLINFPTKHKGRIYGSIQNTIYFSKNLTDVTTSTGTITAKWEEAWPNTNQLDLSELSETIQGMLSDGETLWIGTEKHIRRLVGDSPSNFQTPEIQFNNVGLYAQDTWQTVFAQGQPVGTLWLTPDFKVMGSDFNTYQDVGWPVQDILNRINRAATVPPFAAFVSNGPAEYYMLYIPTNSNPTPDTCLVYDLDSKTWFTWVPFDSIAGAFFLFDAAGNPRWLFASDTGAFYEWKDGLFQDRVNLTPVNYFAEATTSWLDFGDPTLRKGLNQIILGSQDPGVIITVEGAANEAALLTPVTFANTPVISGPLNDLFAPLASAASVFRWFRFTFSSANNLAPSLLTFYNIESVPFHRW